MSTEAQQDAAPKSPLELKAAEQGWNERDIHWLLSTVSPAFQPIALRYGRLCFSLVMQGGQTGIAMGEIQQALGFVASRHVKHKGLTGLNFLLKVVNDFLVKILKDNGISQEVYDECKREVETTGALLNGAEPASQTKGRIILPN